MVRWTEIGIILSPEFITRVNILFISHSNLWIPFERSSFKNISKEKTKDRYFLQSMIEASLFGFISEWLTMETKRGSIHVSLPISLHLSPNVFPKIFTRTSGSWFRLESSRVSSAFSTERSCELSSSRCNPVFALETASLFRDGTSHLASLKGAANRRDGGFSGAFQKDSTAETVVPCGLKRQSCLNRVNEL